MWFITKRVLVGKTREGSRVEVRQWFGERTLWIDNYLQSGGILRGWWSKVLKKWQGRAKRNASILLVGLGGGDLIILINKINKRVEWEVIEKERVVAQCAQKYFGIDKKIKIKIGTAEEEIPKLGIYDLIIVDIYGGKQRRKVVEEQRFAREVGQHLGERGEMVVNYGVDKGRLKKYLQLLKSEIGEVEIVRCQGHYFIWARRVVAESKI